METDVLAGLVKELGGSMTVSGSEARLETTMLDCRPLPADAAGRIHGSLYFGPALLARFGEVDLPAAGGDRIGPGPAGERPLSHICRALERFGAEFPDHARLRGRWVHRKAVDLDIMDFSTSPHCLRGPAVSSVTKTALLAATCCPGTSRIRNPVVKDATLDLFEYLSRAGLAEEEAGEGRTWLVRGIGPPPDVREHRLTPDIAEACTFICAAVVTGSQIDIGNLTSAFSHLARHEERALRSMGVELSWGPASLTVSHEGTLAATDVVASHTGVNTDVQPFFTLMLLQADGPSTVTDLVWEHRFGYVDLLRALGAIIDVHGSSVTARPSRLSWASPLAGQDTRAVAVATLAALALPGPIEVAGLQHLDRGYEDLASKLGGLGADVRRVEDG
jgi:UDP-N-acetylglucosamine 1-carboxyvinyltransferase